MATSERGGRPTPPGQPTRTSGRPPLVQRQARALGDPTRYDIFRFVAEAPEPVDVATVTRWSRLNHNAVRQHLAKLCEAGLLDEEVAARTGPGRRPRLYRLSPAAAGTWGTAGPYERLAELLLEVLRTGRTPREVGVEAGRQAVAADDADDPVDTVEAEVARLGFEPRRLERGSSAQLVLQRCPYESVAAVDGDIVCQLHLGMAEGLVDAVGHDLTLTRFVVEPSGGPGCRLELRRGPQH